MTPTEQKARQMWQARRSLYPALRLETWEALSPRWQARWLRDAQNVLEGRRLERRVIRIG